MPDKNRLFMHRVRPHTVRRIVLYLLLMLAGSASLTLLVYFAISILEADLSLRERLVHIQWYHDRLKDHLESMEDQQFLQAKPPDSAAIKLLNTLLLQLSSEIAHLERTKSQYASKHLLLLGNDSEYLPIQEIEALAARWQDLRAEVHRLLQSNFNTPPVMKNVQVICSRIDQILSKMLHNLIAEESLMLRRVRAAILVGTAGAIALLVAIYLATVIPIGRLTEQLRNLFRQYYLAFFHAPVGQMLLSSNGDIQDINPHGAQLLGQKTPGELLGQNICRLPIQLPRARLEKAHNLIRHKGGIENYPIKLSMPGGQAKTFQASAQRLQGEQQSFFVIFYDITKKVAEEEAYQEYREYLELRLKDEMLERQASMQRYKSLFNFIEDGILLLNEDFEVMEANPAAARLLDTSDATDLKGLNFFRFCKQHDDWRNLQPILERDETVRDFQCQLQTLAGREPTFLLFIQSVRHHTWKGKIYVVMLRDITEKIRMDSEKKRLQEQLQQAQKLENIGQLAGGIAHDFNNLLTGIKGYAQFGIEQTADKQSRDFFEKIVLIADRAADLTRHLLAFSRTQVLQKKNLELNHSILEVLSFLQRVIPSSIQVDSKLTTEPLVVKADRAALSQILVNLCVNARDAMPNGGQLRILTRKIHLKPQEKQFLPGVSGEDFAEIVVSDTGIGMPEEVKNRIFEPFFTTKEGGKGTGLGLSMVYGLVRQHDGSIEVESNPAAGTQFRILLPLSPEPPEEEQRTHLPIQMAGNETILLVEDDPVIRQIVKDYLSLYGYQILEASNGERAWRKLNQAKQQVDLIISDTVMPHVGGLQLYRKVRKKWPSLCFLLISGYNPSQEVEELEFAPNFDFLAKPFQPKELLLKVRELLNKRIYAPISRNGNG